MISKTKNQIWQGAAQRLRSALRWLDTRPVRTCMLLALVLNFVIECFSRRSLVKVLVHTITQPYLFLVGALIIFCGLSISLLLPKRYFFLSLFATVWLGLGVADFVLLSYRVTPLAFIDFELLPSVFSIVGIYLSVWQMVLICALILGAVALLVLLFLRTPHKRVPLRQALPAVLLSAAAVLGAIVLGRYSDTLPLRIGNLADAYQEYGFVYCFSSSIVDRGIDRPLTYDEQMDSLADELSGEDEPEQGTAAVAPGAAEEPEVNVIFLQLESFIDPNEIIKYAYSENPCPNFSRLRKTYPSGYLTVPSIGAGTANTEFEVISGMSLQFFGTGEYPYKTVLRDNTCETVCYNLKEHGYTATAIHNNKATFYDRDEVFANLGFDNFISLEYMNEVRYNPQGWACDDVLTAQILNTLRSTGTQDLIYTISVQGHGKYPDAPLENDTGTIEVYGEHDEIMNSRVTYYINQLAEMDAFIGELIQALTAYEEPVLLVMYGDHLPSLELEEEDMASRDLFRTEYVIWSNYDLEAQKRDLCAYQLSAYILELLGYDDGNLTKLHQNESEEYNYLEELELLEYDMLYGDRIVFDGENPYKPTTLHMGVSEITLQTVAFQDERLYVFGSNFTPYSVVCINGRQQQTQFINSHTLCVEQVQMTDVRSVSVEQVSEDLEVLSETGQ